VKTVSFGPASWIGLVGAVAAAIAPMIGQLADAAAPLGVPDQTWIIVSAVLASVTVAGRMWQAGMNTIYGAGDEFSGELVDELPDEPTDAPG
jgi:hypothetical protein